MGLDRRATILVVGIFTAVAVTTHLAWRITDRNPITGDEPHYLVVADSIVDHGSFEITDAYREEFDRQRISPVPLAPPATQPTPENSHGADGPRGLYSVHAIGLPLVLAVPLAVGGVELARLVLLAFGAFGVLAACWAARALLPAGWERAAAVGVVATGMTFVTASNQVYPDLPAGVLALGVVAWLLRAERAPVGATAGVDRVRWAVAAIAVLPWLHLKLVAPAVVLLVAVLAVERRQRRAPRRLVQLAAPVVASVVLLGGYHVWAFGRLAGPYGEGALTFGGMPVTVLLGLYVDQFQGMFAQNPALLAAPIALVPVLRRSPIAGAAIVVTHLALVVPNALHENWYGGYSFAGRFGVAGALVLAPVAVFGIGRALRERRTPLPVLVVAALAAFNLVQFVRYALLGWDLYNEPRVAPSVYPSVAPPLRGVLPILFTSEWSLRFLPNLVAVAAVAALVVLGALVDRTSARRTGRRVAWVVSIACLAAIVTAGVTTGYPATELDTAGDELPLQRAVPDDGAAVATGAPGVVTFGPVVELGAGRYEFAVDFRADAERPAVGRWELFVDGVDDPLTGGALDAAPDTRTAGGSYVVPDELAGREFQVVTIASGSGPFVVERVVVRSAPSG
jgi:hypothetical protein